jgi:hypothetical protein
MKIFGLTTRMLIVLSAAVWIIYDVIIYFMSGTPATESANIWRWAYDMAAFDFCFGALVAHLFCEFRPPSTQPAPTPGYVDAFQGTIFIAGITWLGWDSWYFFLGKHCSPVSDAVWAAGTALGNTLGWPPMHETWLVLGVGGIVGRLYFQMYSATKFA